MKMLMKMYSTARQRVTMLGMVCTLILGACANRNTAMLPTVTPVPTATLAPTATPVPPTATPLPTPTAASKKTVIAPTPEVVAKAVTGIRVGTLASAFPNLASQQTHLTLILDGTGKANKVLQGNLDVGLNQNTAKKQSQLTVGGNLLNPLLADQLRGFSARGLTLYSLNGQTYVLINTLLTVCVKMKPEQFNINDIERGLSLDAFVGLFAPDGTFPGKLVGEEAVNGIAAKHYALDTVAIKALAAQRGIRDINITQGDIWLASAGDYVVRMNIFGEGTLNNLAGNDFSGKFNVLIEMTGLNNSPEVTLPTNCSRAIELP